MNGDRLSGFSAFFNDPSFSDKIICLTLAPQDEEKKNSQDLQGGDVESAPIDEDQKQLVRDGIKGRIIKELHVSSVLLANSSRFFDKLFRVGMQEASQRCFEFPVADQAEAERLEAIIRFMYFSALPDHWKADDKIAALMLCDRLGDNFALAACCSALAKDLSVDVCCSILDLPESLTGSDHLQDFIKSCHKHLLDAFQDFETLWISDSFLTLNANAVCAILSSDNLQVLSEQTVYQAAVRWFSQYRSKVTQLCQHFASNSSDNDSEVESASRGESKVLERPEAGRIPENQCVSCCSAISSVAAKLLHCLRLPLCSVDFLRDVVRYSKSFRLAWDPLPRRQSSSLSSSSAPRGTQTVQDLFLALQEEAQSWQGFSAERRKRLRPPSTILCKHGSYVVSFRSRDDDDGDDDDEVSLPTRFKKRNGTSALVEESRPSFGEDTAFGSGVDGYATAVGYACAFMDGKHRSILWRFPIDSIKDQRLLSARFPINGYWFRLQAYIDDDAFSFYASLCQSETGLDDEIGFFLPLRFNTFGRDWESGQLVPLRLDDQESYYTSSLCSWGHDSLFSEPWEQTVASRYVSASQVMELMVLMQVTSI